MKNLLVIAYYFPPMGFSGVQRTLKFVKYLPEHGWKPTVLTIVPHAYFAFDDTLLAELEGRPVEIWRTAPAKVFALMQKRRTVAFENEGFRRMLNRLSQFLFIPDNKIGWKKEALTFLETQDLSGFSAVYSSAPPFTAHLLGLEVRRRYNIPLVTDFRDAWVDYPYHRYWTGYHRRKHVALERKVVSGADAVVTTNSFVRNLFLQRHAAYVQSGKFHVIEQGYDAADFAAPAPVDVRVQNSGEVNFVYSGIFYEDRKPYFLYDALVEVKKQAPDIYQRLRFYMVGYVQEQFRRRAEQLGVGERFVYCGYVEHPKAVAWLQQADVLWFNIGAKDKGFETVAPGKVFEYLGSRKPILAIVPENEIRTILQGFAHTCVIPPENTPALVEALLSLARARLAETLPEGDAEKIAYFDRRNLSAKLAGILTNLSG